MKPSRSSWVVVAALLLAVVAGCGRSEHTSINYYCRGRLGCGIEPGGTQGELDACVARYEEPDGSAHDQCFTSHLAACLGDCFHDHGCGIFDQNDPCNCELKDYGCPAQ
jgi:hypothetical protein